MSTARVHDGDTLDAHHFCLERLEAPHTERPHACMGGLVFIGHMVEDEAGEEVEVFEAFPCKRCAEQEALKC